MATSKKTVRASFLAVISLVAINCRHPSSPGAASQRIVADHTAVDRYDDIPQIYIDKVKKMLLDLPGESHARGYVIGLDLLASIDPDYAVSTNTDTQPEEPAEGYLRASLAAWGDRDNAGGWQYLYGEEDWYTNATAIARTKAHLDHCNANGIPVSAFGFGWCYDMSWQNGPSGTADPVHNVRWAGTSLQGPDGDTIWGLDAGDVALTGNTVCMDTYLDATSQYGEYCASKGYPTRVFFTTGPIDDFSGENALQREIKHDYIRAYAKADPERILFDYADILAWSDAGAENAGTWDGRSYQLVADDNMLDLAGGYSEDGDHIGQRGALRLGKAMWWMLARMAGWDGN